MESYVYALLGLAVALPAMLLAFRAHLMPGILLLGLLGGITGPLSEFFYFRDYWLPPTSVGLGVVSPEDFLFGFGILILSIVIYPALTGKRLQSHTPPRRSLYLIFLLIGVTAMIIFNYILGINSIFVSSITFLIYTTVILKQRPDLLRPALISTALVILYITFVYLILFNILAPEFWQKYWLLANTTWGVTILGNIPLTELIWYAACVFFASTMYAYTEGKVLVPSNTSSTTPSTTR